MGCWNKTCGLSKLHITAGDEVLVFVLEQNHSDSERCYATAFWGPVLLPFYSEYNDYGGGENSFGVGLNYILDGLRKNLVEMEVGENECHDIAVKKENFGEEQFFETVHENRLHVRDQAFGGKRMVDFVMFRKDIVDDILDNYEVEKYVGDGTGTHGWGNAYIKYKFADVVADVPAYLDLVQAYSDEHKDDTFRYFVKLGDVVEWEHPNKVGWYVGDDSYRFSRIIRPTQIILDLMRNGNRGEAEAVLIDYLKGAFLNMFIETTRNVWTPGAHEGSQCQDEDGYRALISAMTRALDREKAEQDED
jgi:hypothetical protein